MDKLRSCIALAITLIWIISGTAAGAREEKESASTTERDTLLAESGKTKKSLADDLIATRTQMAELEAQRIAFMKDFQNVFDHLHLYRANLRQRLLLVQLIYQQWTGYSEKDTLTYSQAYWQNLGEDLKKQMESSSWQFPDGGGEELGRLTGELNSSIDLLNTKMLQHPMMKSIVTALINLLLKQPLDPAMTIDASAAVGKLRQALSGTKWEPSIFKGIKNSLAGIEKSLTKIDDPLASLEEYMTVLNQRLTLLSSMLEHRLTKLDTLLGSVQVLEKNIHSLHDFNPAEVRQQLIFLRNQNRFLDYEHRVLKSYNGVIESAIQARDCKAILEAIFCQDPEAGKIDLEKNGYLIFIGAGGVNLPFLIHEENHAPSDYLYAIDSLYAIWLEDNPWETYDITLSVELLQSEFELTFGQFKTVLEARRRGEEQKPEPTLFFYGMKRLSDISSPSRINLSIKRNVLQPVDIGAPVTQVIETSDVFSTSYIVHEKSLVHMSVGIAAGYVKKSNFKIAGNQLAMSESGDKELDQHLYALLNFHLGGRDIDRFQQQKFLSLQKLMLQAGLGVSQNPLDRIYLGLGYRIQKELQLDLLYYWRRGPKLSQSVSLDDVATIEDAKKKFDEVYQKGHVAFGLSFYPQRLFGFLGL